MSDKNVCEINGDGHEFDLEMTAKVSERMEDTTTPNIARGSSRRSYIDNMRSLRQFQSKVNLVGRETGFVTSNRFVMSQLQQIGAEDSQEAHDTEHHDHDEETHLQFYCPPLQRQYWDEPIVLPHVNWGDLFFDLLFVAAAYNLAHVLKSGFERGYYFKALVHFVGLFGPIWNIWAYKFIYDARFTVIDLFHRLVEIARYVCLAMAMVHVKSIDEMVDPLNRSTFTFATCVTVELCLTILLNVELMYKGIGDESVKIQSRNIIMRTLLPQLAFYIASAFTAAFVHHIKTHDLSKGDSDSTKYLDEWGVPHVPVILLVCGYCVSQMSWLFNRLFYEGLPEERVKVVPLNIDYAIHRLGEWVMLMLGESVLSLLIVEVTENSEYYKVVVSGIITVIFIQDLHFESQPSHYDSHALQRSHFSGIFYMYLVQLQSMALICLGVGYKMMLSYIAYQSEHDNEAEEEYKSGYDYDDGDGHRVLKTMNSHELTAYERILGGGSGIGLTTEAMQLSAYVLCIALAVVLIATDLSSFTHLGYKINMMRFSKKDIFGQKRMKRVLFLILKVATYISTVTIPLWRIAPWQVSMGCMIIVILAVILRISGWGLFANAKTAQSSNSDHNEG